MKQQILKYKQCNSPHAKIILHDLVLLPHVNHCGVVLNFMMKETTTCIATNPNGSFPSVHQELLAKARFNLTCHSLILIVMEPFLGLLI
jgi:hypothetical protein